MEENLIKPVNTFAEHSNDTSALENHVDIQSFSLFYDKFEAVRKFYLYIIFLLIIFQMDEFQHELFIIFNFNINLPL